MGSRARSISFYGVLVVERTPFGHALAELRAARGMRLKDLASQLNVTPAYLSALETGRRGVPNRRFLHKICQIFAIIWDEAETLAALAHASNPHPRIDVRGKSGDHVRLANLIATRIPQLKDQEATAWLQAMEKVEVP